MKHMLYQAARFAPVTSECFSADLAPSFPPFQLKIYLAVQPVELPHRAIMANIGSAVDLLVHIGRTKGHRSVSEIAAMRGFDNEGNECKLDALNP